MLWSIHLKRVGLAAATAAATVSVLLTLPVGEARAGIVETQNLGTFGGWSAYRDRYDDGTGWTCASEAPPVNRPASDNSVLFAYPTYLGFWRAPELAGHEEVFLQVGELAFEFYINTQTSTAFSRDEDDFLVLLALAYAPADIVILVHERGKLVEYVFPASGFRDTYRLMGMACDFDTSLLLEAAQ